MTTRSAAAMIGFVILASGNIWQLSRVKRENSLTTPSISIAILDVNRRNQTTTINARMVIRNPMPTDVTATKIHYALQINDHEILRSNHMSSIVINANDSTVLETSVELLTKLFNNHMEQQTTTDTVNCSFETSLTLKLPVTGEKEFHERLTKIFTSSALN